MQRNRSRTPSRSLLESCRSPFLEEQAEEETQEEDEEVPSHNERYAWHFDMLHDEDRLAAFTDAFRHLPRSALESGTAVDIGCGTGILGMSLLKQRPELSRVIAFESDSVLAEVTRANGVKNKLQSKLKVYAQHSTSMSLERKDRAKLLVAEILDAGLLGEDCLGTLRHAAQCLLSEDYFAIPASADVFACAVESSILKSFQGVGGAWWAQWAPSNYRRDHGDANPHDVALERLVKTEKARVLTEQFYVLSFDFEDLPESFRSKMLEVKVKESGRLDAIVFWWYCYMLRGDKTPTMSNAPSWLRKRQGREIDHWRQAVCVLPEARVVHAGELLRLAVFHTDEDIWFRIQEELPAAPLTLPKASSNLALVSPSRLWMLSEEEKYKVLQGAMYVALKSLFMSDPYGNMQVLDLSDGPFLSLLAFDALKRLYPKSRGMRKMLRYTRRPLISLESTEADLQVAKDMFSQRRSPLDPKVLHLLGSPSLAPKSLSMICGEPFARECEGLACDSQLWHHWAQVDALRFALKADAILFPRFFRVKAALLSCEDLWRRRQEIRGRVHGVDVSAVNQLHPERCQVSALGDGKSSGRLRFPCGLWQVEHRILGDSVVLSEVDLAEDFPSSLRRFPESTLRSSQPQQTVHALATWTEVWFSKVTGWMPTVRISKEAEFEASPAMQGVLLAKKPGRFCTLQVKPFFNAQDGSLYLQASWADGSEF